MAADFGYLDALQINDQSTTEYRLEQLSGVPVLVVAPATPDNKAWLNVVLKRNKSRPATRQKTVSVEAVQKDRDSDREMIALHIIKDWRGVKDRAGNDVPCNTENALAYLKALPDWIVDDLRNFVANVNNFVELGVDEDEQIKN